MKRLAQRNRKNNAYERAMKILMSAILTFGLLFFSVSYAQTAKPQKPAAAPTPPVTPEFDFMNFRINWLENLLDSSSATLDCKGKGFSSFIMKTPKLQMFASCENVEPYLEGHKVTLKIGNPHSFSFGGISGELTYGKGYPYSTTEISFAGVLVSGAWTTLTVTISPSKPEDLRTMFATISATTAIATR
jgi:hypothetical protein